MNSVVSKQEAKADRHRTKPKLKIQKIFNSFVAKMSPSKLAVDAVPVKKNDGPASIVIDEIEENRVTSIDPWQSVSSSDEFADELLSTNNSQLMPSPSRLISPNANHLPSYGLQNANRNNLAVLNVGVQNNYNFSQINGLHIGNVNVLKAKPMTNGTSNGGNKELGAEQTSTEASAASPVKILKSKSIKELLVSTDPLDESIGKKTMRILSKHMGGNWRFTLRELGFTEAEIDQKCATYLNLNGGVYEIVYQSLLAWNRKNADATVGQLCTFLWEKDQRECVSELKNQLKRERTKSVSESLSTTGFETTKRSTSTKDDPLSCDKVSNEE